MAKTSKTEEGKGLATTGTSEVAAPDFSKVLESETLSLAQKRKKVLELLGEKKTRRKYKNKEERKTAAKERRLTRVAKRRKILEEHGLEPQARGPKLTKEEKKAKRSRKGKDKREFLREMAKANPKLAKEFGIDIGRFKLK